ncbi:MAG: 16S rRNA (cytidine(1402)-2'-O)-methyltransferase [Candidatus Woodwardiibium sp.]
MMAEDTKSKSFVEPGVLYVVPTPIGNMADVTERARIVLAGVDLIAAEDTRNTGRLLALLGLKKPCVAYHEHNARASGVHILAALKAGKSCALVTDAGTPAVSDPGEQLVADCAREGVRVVPLPGACAAVCALSGAGLLSRRFAFEGFLPDKKGERERYLAGLRGDPHTLVFYIAPHDAQRDLADLYRALGDRRAALCRELTKRNEEILRLPLGELKDCPFTIRGEMALVVEGASPAESWESLSVEAHVALYVGQGMPEMDAIKAVAADRGLPKSEVYARVKIKKDE